MTYLEKIFGDRSFLLSTEVPSNSRFLVVRELEANLLKEILPILLLLQKNQSSNNLRKLIIAFNSLKTSESWKLIYDFGADVAAGKFTSAETLTLEEYLSYKGISKAFSLKDAYSLVTQILKDFSITITDGIKTSVDILAKNLKRRVMQISQSLFIGGMVDSLSNGENPEEVYVIRIVYPGACKHCVQTFLDASGTPKVFRLSDLISNGEDIYRNPSQYVPVVYQLHPNCRCGILRVNPEFTKEQLFDILLTAQEDYTAALKMNDI